MRNLSKKTKVVVAGVAAGTLALSGVAYAYWTTTGAGSGSATAASANGTLVLHAAFDSSKLYPGGDTSVTFTADNAGDTTLYVTKVQFKDVVFTPAAATPAATCDVTKFSMIDVTSNTAVAKGNGQAVTGTGHLLWDNDEANSQDGCKGGSLKLEVTSN